MDDTTLPRGPDSLAARPPADAARPALVVLWSREEPERVGEVLLVPTGGPWTVGRRDRRRRPDLLEAMRQRPGRSLPTGPLASRWLSREQLQVRVEGDTLALRNVGRLELKVNGHPTSRARVGPGDVVELDRELLLLVRPRPAVLPGDGTDLLFGQPDAHGYVGESPAAWELRQRLAFARDRGGHVLLLGPSGSGKELSARSLHTTGPFVARNAATLPEGLVDAELFGSERNYPQSGMPERPGLVGQAHGGTLFLDELGELPQPMQARLLRLMDAGEYQRLGSARTRHAELRVLGATNRSVDVLAHDLAARFDHHVRLPGLQDRPEDIPLLARHLLHDAPPRFLRAGRPKLSPALVTALARHPWTTHVRELRRVLLRSVEQSPGTWLDVPAEVPTDAPEPPRMVDPEELDADALRDAMARCGGVKERAWRELGLRSRHQLRRLMKKHGVE